MGRCAIPRAPRPIPLHHRAIKAQINPGIYSSLDERRGSGQISRYGGKLISTAEAIVPYQAVSSGYAMVSVNFKLAILTVLANWPDRRATIDEIREEIGVIFANGDQTDLLKRLSALGDIDIFQTGLVSRNEDGFQITDAG